MATVGTLLVEVVGDTSSLSSALANGEKLVASFGSRIFNAGTRVAAGVSLPVAAFMRTVAKINLEFDAAMTQSLAIMDDVSEEMRDRMEKRAMDLSRLSKFSAKDIAAGYYDLASAGFTAQGALDNIGTVTKFAQAGLMSMETAGEHLAGAVKALGTDLIGTTDEAEAMAKVADVLTKANNNALGTVEDFATALTTRFASGMKTANMGLEEGVAFLMAFAEQNIKGKEASQQAWMALRDLQTRAIKSADAFAKYGISVYDVNGELQNMATILKQLDMAMAGFSRQQLEEWQKTGIEPTVPAGKALGAMQRRQMMLELRIPDRSVTALQKVIDMGDEIFRLYDVLKDSAGEVDRVFEKQGEAVSVKLARAWHGLEAAAIKAWTGIKPIAVDVIEWLTKIADKANELAGKWSALDKETRQWLITAAAATVLLGPVMMFVGSISMALIPLMGGMKLLLKVVGDVGLAFLMWIDKSAALAAFPAKVKAMTDAWASMQGVLGAIGRLFTNLWGVAWPLFKEWGPRLLVVYGIYKMLEPALQRIWGHLSKILDVAGGSAMQTVLNMWKGFQQFLVSHGATWNNLVAIVSAVWRVLKATFTLIQLGWVEIVRVGETAAKKIGQAWDFVTQVFAGMKLQVIQNFQQLGREISWFAGEVWNHMIMPLVDFIKKIPLIGPAFQLAFHLASIMASEFANMMLHIFDLVKQGLNILVQDFRNFAAQVMANTPWAPVLKIWALVKYGKTPLAEALDSEATAFENVVKQIQQYQNGVTTLQNTQRSLYDTLKPVLGRTGVSIDPARMPAMPIAPGANIPAPVDDRAVRDAQRLKDLYEELMGQGKRQWQDITKVLAEHKEEIYASEDAMLRLWEYYKKVRLEADQIPELEEKFKTQIAVENIERLQDALGSFFHDLYPTAGQNELEKNIFQLQEFVRTQLEVQSQMKGGSKVFSPEFFKKYGKDIEELDQKYQYHSMEMAILIDEYKQWLEIGAKVERTTAQILMSHEAYGAMIGEHAEMMAKLKDKERELVAFRLGESDRVLRGLQKNYNEQELEYNKMLAEMANQLKKMSGVELEEGTRKYLELVSMKEEYLNTVSRLELERAAEAVGINRTVLRSFKNLTDEQVKMLIKVRLAANDTMLIYQKMATGFQFLADVFDQSGEGTLSWLAKLADLMREATDVGAQLKISFTAIKGILGGEGGIDWKNLAVNIADMFQAVAQGISVMNRATQSASRMKNAMGGAVAGAQIGFSVGGWWGALIGGIGGAIFGAMRENPVQKTIREVAQGWGVTITEQLANTIDQEARARFGNRRLAELMHFGEILEQDGGLSAENLQKFLDKMGGFFLEIAKGSISASDGMAEFSENFGAFADYADKRLVDLSAMFQRHFMSMVGHVAAGTMAVTDVRAFLEDNFTRFAENIDRTGGIASRAFNNIVDMVQALGAESESMREFFRNVTGEGGTTWATVVRGITYSFKDLSDEIQNTRDEIKSIERDIANGEGDDNIQRMADAQAKLNRLLAQGKTHAAEAGPELQRMGLIVLATFDAALKRGLTWSEAMGSVSDALEEIRTAFDTLGISADNPALAQLMNMNKMFTENRALFEGIDAMTRGLGILSKLGALNSDTFKAMNQQIQDMFTRAQAAVTANGGAHVDALRTIVPYLEQVRRAAREYGFEIDENTQRLIDQAIESGLMSRDGSGDARTLEESFARVGDELERMIELLEEALRQMGLLGQEARNVTVPTGPGGGGGEGGGGGGPDTNNVVGPGVPDSSFAYTRAARNYAYAAAADAAGVSPTGAKYIGEVTVNIEGRTAAQALVPFIPAEVTRLGLNRHNR